MSHFGAGYVPVRRGLMDHAFDGLMTPTEHHATFSMLMLANAAKGMWRGSAPALTTILGYLCKHTMAEALDGLEAKGYILRDFAPGRRGNYPIIIDKFLITRGRYTGQRLDLAATKRKYGIPEGRLDKLTRKPLFAAIAKACSHPVFVAETDRGVDGWDDDGLDGWSDSGADEGSVSRREKREESEGGREGSAQTPSSLSGSAEGREEPSESPYSTEAEAERSAPVSPVQSESKSAFSASPTPQMSAPEQLAVRFFLYQHRPANLNTPATLKLWVSIFTRLITTHGYDDLSGAMRWAFEVDPFWPSKLIRSADPLGYFELQLSKQIMSRYFALKTSEVNKSKSQTKKEGNDVKHQSRTSAPRATGKQAVDNSSAAEEVKRRFAQRLGCQE